MPKSYCYTVSLCGWGWVMFVPVGWVLVIFLWFIQASVSIQPPNPLITPAGLLSWRRTDLSCLTL